MSDCGERRGLLPSMIRSEHRFQSIAASEAQALSTVAEMRPRKLLGVAYLAAYMLRNGERVADFVRKDKDSLVPPNLRISKATLTDSLAEEAYRPALYADCADADVELARALLTPEPSLPALTRLRLSEGNYGSVRRHYIELTQDKAVSLSLQRKLIAASPCASVSSIEASHSAYFSRPGELAAVVHGIAMVSHAAVDAGSRPHGTRIRIPQLEE